MVTVAGGTTGSGGGGGGGSSATPSGVGANGLPGTPPTLSGIPPTLVLGVGGAGGSNGSGQGSGGNGGNQSLATSDGNPGILPGGGGGGKGSSVTGGTSGVGFAGRVTITWADPVLQQQAIPTLQEWALMLMGLLLGGLVWYRSQRKGNMAA
ncbi:MAG: IPTL-CTERM sorting domain-containing protein [Candidatus Competibacteraceae bacterium]|nr:MAG: IPTL-CTERM sorting domain-containing protein [Candidatus Competibacteraceae bacterium]